MLIETERLIITEFTMDMAQVAQENSVDEDKVLNLKIHITMY